MSAAPVRLPKSDPFPSRGGLKNRRRAMIAKLHLGAKEIGLAEDDRRALMLRVTGKRSAADMTDAELGLVVEELVAKGWKAAAPGGRVRIADHPAAKKARALWISLAQLGVVRNPAEAALEAFAQRQLGTAKLQWANGAHVYSLIEALKGMAQRAGWNQDVDSTTRFIEGVSTTIILKRRLARAQARKLHPENALSRPLAGIAAIAADERALDALIAEQGAEIRAAMDDTAG